MSHTPHIDKRPSIEEKVEDCTDDLNSSIPESIPSYEEAAVNIGAPVEVISPLGYHVGAISVMFLNVGTMIGTGIFSTREYHLYLFYDLILDSNHCFSYFSSGVDLESYRICWFESDLLGHRVCFCWG